MPERVSGPPPSMLPGAALSSLAGASRLVSAGRGSTSGSGRCPSAFRGPPFRLWTVPERVSGPPPRCCQAQHFRASRLVSAGSTARFGAPPLDAARRSTFEPRGSFLLAGAALQALDGARARFGALSSFAARFCWQGQHFRLWTVPERVSGPPPSMLPGAALWSFAARFCRGGTSGSGRCPSAFRGPPPRCCQAQHFRASRLVSAGRGSTSGSGRCPSAFRAPPRCCQAALWSLAARFCWQGQHFRLWTVPERVSGPPPRCCQAQHFRAGRGSTSGSGRCPSAFRGPPPSMLPGAALWSLAARFCWQGQHFRLGRCLSAFRGPPPWMLPGAALWSLAARFCWQGQHFRLWTVPERVSGPPPHDAARRSTFEPRGSLAARFCWQGQHFRLWTVPERVSGPPPSMLPGAAL